MASCGRNDEGIKYDINEPTSRCCHLATKTPSGPPGATNIESPSDVVTIPLIEFAVNFNDHDDLNKLDDALKRRGVKIVSSNLDNKTVHVQFADCRRAERPSLDVQSLQRYVEQETGFLAVVKGMGELSSAVAELRPPPSSDRPMFGVVRMSQMMNGACFVDGSITDTEAPLNFNSAPPKQHPLPDSQAHRLRLAIHQFGDLSSDTYNSIGQSAIEIDDRRSSSRPTSVSVQRIVPQCEVAQLIGKSVALSALSTDTADSRILSAGVIARASTIGANKKQVCACSGKTLWQERVERQRN